MAGELRALSGEERAMVEAYPLPPGVEDALVNKAQLEMALGASQTTISAWVRQGMPYEEAGTNGRQYRFRLSIAHAWVQHRRDEDRRQREAGDEAARQLKLALLGDGADDETTRLSPKQQRELLELEHARNLAARDRRELIRRDDVVTGVEECFATLRDALDALPDRLARELALDGAAVEVIEAACDDALHGAARAVGELIGDEPAAAEDLSDPSAMVAAE